MYMNVCVCVCAHMYVARTWKKEKLTSVLSLPGWGPSLGIVGHKR